MNEDIQQVFAFPQNVIGTAAHDHAGTFTGDLANDLALDQEDLVVHRQLLCAHIQTIQEAGGLHLLGLFDVLLGKAAFFRGHEDQFLIVKRNTKLFGQPLTDGAAAGAIFSGNRDHWYAHGAPPLGHCFKRPTRPPESRSRVGLLNDHICASKPISRVLFRQPSI